MGGGHLAEQPESKLQHGPCCRQRPGRCRQLPAASDFRTWSSDPSNARPPAQIARPLFKNSVQLSTGEHDIFRTITAIDDSTITVEKRNGATLSVDTANATTTPLTLDEPVRVVGSGTETALRARSIWRAKGLTKIWPPDR